VASILARIGSQNGSQTSTGTVQLYSTVPYGTGTGTAVLQYYYLDYCCTYII
jgi:hypothetical protein